MRTGIHKRPVLLLLPLILCGCVPAVGNYHEPVSAEGKVEGGKCTADRDKLGPPSKLEVRRGSVYITMDGNHLSGLSHVLHIVSSGDLYLAFGVPASSRVDLDWQQLTLHDRATGTPMTFTSRMQGTYAHHTQMLPTGSIMDSPALVKALAEEDEDLDQSDADYAYFKLDLRVAKVPDDLELHIPALTVDGTSYPPVEVEFKHTVGAYCEPFEPVILP